ncbi:MAG: hypothetical protein HYZ53_04130 [Planctomycetes bacterium]|nr:hypothetical protein [Planctomycetota bacterium]
MSPLAPQPPAARAHAGRAGAPSQPVPHPLRDARGMALLLSIGSLALLSLLGVVFVTEARHGAGASAGYLDSARARLVAQAGLDYAVARLRVDAGRSPVGDPAGEWHYGGGPLATTAAPSYRGGSACGHAFSTTVGGTHAPQGDQAVLKILDTTAQLDLNLRIPALAQVLDTLGRAIAQDRRALGLSPVDPIAGRGARIVALRDALGGLTTKDTLRLVLGDDDFVLARDFLTVHAWQDPRTIAPTGASFPEGMPGFRTEPRAPVSVNTASWPILVALLADLRGPAGGPIPYQTAADVAGALLQRRSSTPPGQGPFASWPDFHAFVRGLTANGSLRLRQEWADAILANADPNFHPSRLNLERVLDAPIDKTDLAYRTTEFCLRPMGLYEITSLGRLFRADGRGLAASQLSAVVRVFRNLYHTVQADFEARRASDRSENAGTWPNPGPRARGVAADWAGHLQLQTDVPAPDPQLASPTLEVLLRDGLAADAADGVAAPAGNQEAGPDVARAGGDLLPEGLFCSRTRGELTAWSTDRNVNPHSGGLEFWVKFDRPAAAGFVPLLLLTVPENGNTGVQHRIRARLDPRALTIESTRLYYVSRRFGNNAARQNAPSPYEKKRTTFVASLPGAGTPHEWHQVRVSWTDGTRQSLEVDGVSGSESSSASGSNVAFEGWPPYDPSLTLGGAATTVDGLEICPATVDDLRVYGPPGLMPSLGTRRSRFEDAAVGRVGRFEGAFDPLPGPIRLLGVSWTEWTPDSWSGRPFVQPPTWIELALDTGSGFQTVANGAGTAALDPAGVGTVPADRELRYEVRFRRDLGLSPLNVTPILDDLLLAYVGSGADTLSFTWNDDE